MLRTRFQSDRKTYKPRKRGKAEPKKKQKQPSDTIKHWCTFRSRNFNWSVSWLLSRSCAAAAVNQLILNTDRGKWQNAKVKAQANSVDSSWHWCVQHRYFPVPRCVSNTFKSYISLVHCMSFSLSLCFSIPLSLLLFVSFRISLTQTQMAGRRWRCLMQYTNFKQIFDLPAYGLRAFHIPNTQFNQYQWHFAYFITIWLRVNCILTTTDTQPQTIRSKFGRSNVKRSLYALFAR